MENDGCCARGNIKKQVKEYNHAMTIYISFHSRRYGSMPQDMRSHQFKNKYKII